MAFCILHPAATIRAETATVARESAERLLTALDYVGVIGMNSS